jgi:hypothetical protein
LRTTANSYLSQALSARLKEIWPNAEVRIDLPEKIQDLVAVSDITFRSSPNLPQISLPSHGTGAQSAILYQTHYVLDSDRSLHLGLYFPVWLLEEPESFLHADIALQLGRFLSSPEWLDSIQMIISTHSPLILAGSRQQPALARWVLVADHEIKWQKQVDSVTPQDLQEVATIMGDSNFPVYFEASTGGTRLFIEDSRQATADKLREAGIDVTNQLNGVVELRKYMDVITTLDAAMPGDTYFMADADKGLKELKRYIESGELVTQRYGWQKIRIAEQSYLLLLPAGNAIEDLFVEWPDILELAYADLFDEKGQFRPHAPMDLTRAASELRRTRPDDRAEVLRVLARHQDVKDRFWADVAKHKIADNHVETVVRLMK